MLDPALVEGLKFALSKGEPLEKAMRSFFNAGYKKEEIEEAARNLYTQQEAYPQLAPIENPAQNPLTPAQPNPPSQPHAVYQPPRGAIGQTHFRPYVSNYGSGYGSIAPDMQKTAHKAIIVLIIILIFTLLGLLAAIFFFREQVTELFHSLFG